MSSELPPPRPWNKIKRWLGPLVAVTALVWVIRKNGGVSILQSVVEQLGWRWPFLLLPWLATITCIFFGYRTALPGRGRAVPLRALFVIERA
ncbi:MAG: hypothetical protein MK135_06540, partial [Polyangiaceae bacterium]|nr:hypothetical protein [Polyangiaceae bacterium]